MFSILLTLLRIISKYFFQFLLIFQSFRYQSRCLFRHPVAVNKGQKIIGTLSMVANEHSSFRVTLKCEIDGCNISAENIIELHDQHYEYLQKAFE